MDTPRRCECSDVARMAYRAGASDLRSTRRACEKCRFPGVGKGLSQLGPVARMPALSAQACRTVASATACVEIPTLDVHWLPCDGVASLLPRLQEAAFTLYGATTRHYLRAGATPKSILIPRRQTFMFGAAELTLDSYDSVCDAENHADFCIFFIDAQTQCQSGRYQYTAAGSRYELAGCKRFGAKRAPGAVGSCRKHVFFEPRIARCR